jgi:heat shock protein HslJ
MLAQVITDHEAIISVSMGEVDGGTIDGYWDIFTQQEISGGPPDSQDDVALENTKWSLRSYGQPGNLSDILADTEITLELDSTEGTVKGLAGCNSYFGSYQLQGNHLSIPGPIAVTEMYCMESAGIMDQEQDYLSILQLTTGYDIEGNQLQLNCGNQILIYISTD